MSKINSINQYLVVVPYVELFHTGGFLGAVRHLVENSSRQLLLGIKMKKLREAVITGIQVHFHL